MRLLRALSSWLLLNTTDCVQRILQSIEDFTNQGRFLLTYVDVVGSSGLLIRSDQIDGCLKVVS